MRCAPALLAACCVASQRSVLPPTPPPAQRPGVFQRMLVMVQGEAVEPIERYSGTFYGVTARVHLNMRTRIASVALRGVVLGGTVSGAAG